MKQIILIAIVLMLVSGRGWSEEGSKDKYLNSGDKYVNSIRVIGQSATMYEHKDLGFTRVSGPVGSVGIPNIIRKGNLITVKKNIIRANIIIATTTLGDMKNCTIAETKEDLPTDHERDRLWIYVKNCQVIE